MMQATPCTDDLSLHAGELGVDRPLLVFMAYADRPAGEKAMSGIANLARIFQDHLEIQPLPWSFTALADPDWRAQAEHEAASADILLVSSDLPNPLPPVVEDWIEGIIRAKHGSETAVILLLGAEGRWDSIASPRLQRLRSAARRAEVDFFAPSLDAHTLGLGAALERIHQRAEAVTPVLTEILQRPLPAPRWEARPAPAGKG